MSYLCFLLSVVSTFLKDSIRKRKISSLPTFIFELKSGTSKLVILTLLPNLNIIQLYIVGKRSITLLRYSFNI